MNKAPRTPCIGVCSTGIGDDVCRGCKRFAHEIIDWNRYSADERWAVMNRIDGFLTQIVATKFVIVDVDILKQQIQFQQITFDAEKNPHCWLFELLRYGAGQIDSLDSFGVKLRDEHAQKSLLVIKKEIEDDIYQLACSYFLRYVKPGMIAEEVV